MIGFSKRIGGLTFMLVRCLAYSDEPFHSVSVGFDEDAGYYFAGNRDNKMIGQHWFFNTFLDVRLMDLV